MRILKAAEPGFLLSVMDGKSLELRILRLMDRRVLWTGGRRTIGVGACVLAMAVLSAGVAAAVRVMPFSPEAQLLHASGPLPRFEVATIKPGKDDERMMVDLKGPAAILMHNFTVKDMLQLAYGIRSDSQLEGVSGWMTTKRFDIEAKLSDAEVATEEKMQIQQKFDRLSLMTQALLAERLQLKTSETSKEVQVYELVVAKGGPKLTPGNLVNGAPQGNPLQGSSGKLQAIAVPISTLTNALGHQPELGGGGPMAGGRMIVDKTGLTGTYDWTLRWAPANDASLNSDAPGLFTALEEQLGLKLVSAKAPVQVLVVEHVEPPSSN